MICQNINILNIIIIKILLIIINFFIIYELKDKIIEEPIEYYFHYILCKYFFFERNYNCKNQIFTNKNFYDNIIEINKNNEILINIKKTKIENIFLLIGIMPFLKNKSLINYQINNKAIFKLFKIIFINKIFKKTIKISENDFFFFEVKIEELLNYNWELIPDEKIIENIRYIINNYYNKSYLQTFDKLLNSNFKYYIRKKKNSFSIEQMKKLMSKLIIFYFSMK